MHAVNSEKRPFSQKLCNYILHSFNLTWFTKSILQYFLLILFQKVLPVIKKTPNDNIFQKILVGTWEIFGIKDLAEFGTHTQKGCTPLL